LNYINRYNPDIIFLNINITEKQDTLQYVMESVKNTGYLERTFILAGHSDEVALEIAKKDYMEIFLENKDTNQMDLSEKAINIINEEGYGDVLSVINLLDKTDQDRIASGILKENLVPILQSIEYNYVGEQINASLKLNYSAVKQRVFMLDRIDSITTMIGENALSLIRVLDRLLNKVKQVIEVQTRSLLIVKNSVEMKICDKYFPRVVEEIYCSFIEQEKVLYDRDNQDLRWITVDTGLYEMKNDLPGQYHGISYDITPGYDFAAAFNRGILAGNDAQQIFELTLNIVSEEDKKLLWEKFKTNFSRILYEMAHVAYITNNLDRILEIYMVRFGKRIYYSVPMTTERKRRMYSLIESIGSDRSYIESLIRIALELASEELYL
jgi:hypothetical protein